MNYTHRWHTGLPVLCLAKQYGQIALWQLDKIDNRICVISPFINLAPVELDLFWTTSVNYIFHVTIHIAWSLLVAPVVSFLKKSLNHSSDVSRMLGLHSFLALGKKKRTKHINAFLHQQGQLLWQPFNRSFSSWSSFRKHKQESSHWLFALKCCDWFINHSSSDSSPTHFVHCYPVYTLYNPYFNFPF